MNQEKNDTSAVSPKYPEMPTEHKPESTAPDKPISTGFRWSARLLYSGELQTKRRPTIVLILVLIFLGVFIAIGLVAIVFFIAAVLDSIVS